MIIVEIVMPHIFYVGKRALLDKYACGNGFLFMKLLISEFTKTGQKRVNFVNSRVQKTFKILVSFLSKTIQDQRYQGQKTILLFFGRPAKTMSFRH